MSQTTEAVGDWRLDRHKSIHLVIGPGGVFMVDSRQYRGRLQLDPSGGLWHGRYPLTPTLQAVSFEADQAAVVLPDPGLAVVPIVAVHGAPGALGRGRGARCPGGGGQAPAKHAPHPSGSAGARAGRRPGRPGAGPLPRCRLTATTRARRRLLCGSTRGAVCGTLTALDQRRRRRIALLRRFRVERRANGDASSVMREGSSLP